MDAKQRNLKHIFDAQSRYLVPLYQRPYVWQKEKQWEPLWEDLQTLAERYIRKEPFRPHFMGAVVLEQVNVAAGLLDIRLIIDGQQRLTTLQIVIEAASDVCEGLGDVAATYANALRKLTRNDPRDDDPDEIYKVWPTNVDREHFRRVMSAVSPADLRNKYGDQAAPETGFAIADAYVYFHDKIADWLPKGDITALKQRLDALQNALYWGLLLVVIDLDEKDDAQVIFETLNARGTPLLASDLVKNYLLHQAEARGHNLNQLYFKYWEPFDSTHFWRQEVRTGRFKRPHIEVFLQHYLSLLTQDEVPVTSLFNTFRSYLKEHSEIDPVNYLSDLNRYGEIYRQFYHMPADTPEGLFFRRVEALDTTTVFPLLLQVFEQLGTSEKAERRRAILGDLESFLVRRMVCELTTKNYNNLFLGVGKEFAKAPSDQWGATLRSYLLQQTSDIGIWPDDDTFHEKWRKIEAYKRIKPQARLRLILEALELKLRSSPLAEHSGLPNKKLSIEHILPQHGTANYPLPEDTQEAKDVREALIHTLGNLTLVTGSMNSTLSNDPWNKKRKTLNKGTVLLLNAELQAEEEWTETKIKRRGEDLFKLAKKIWPRPVS